MHKILDKCVQFLQISDLFPIFEVFLSLYVLTSDIGVLLNKITSTFLSLQMHENWR